jgi:glutaredoxin
MIQIFSKLQTCPPCKLLHTLVKVNDIKNVEFIDLSEDTKHLFEEKKIKRVPQVYIDNKHLEVWDFGNIIKILKDNGN